MVEGNYLEPVHDSAVSPELASRREVIEKRAASRPYDQRWGSHNLTVSLSFVRRL
jgi:hypothetical protein